MGGGGGGGQTVSPTADQVKQQQINAELWNYYQTNYKPVIDKYVAQTIDPERKTLQEKAVAGQINAEVMKNVDPSKVSANPVANAERLNKLAAVGTGAQIQGQGGVRSREIADTQNVINIGRGQATAVQADIGEIAGQSLRSEIANLETQQQSQAAIEDAYGSMAGAVAAGLLRPKSSSAVKPRTIDYPGNVG
jgi:hypothetical protein